MPDIPQNTAETSVETDLIQDSANSEKGLSRRGFLRMAGGAGAGAVALSMPNVVRAGTVEGGGIEDLGDVVSNREIAQLAELAATTLGYYSTSFEFPSSDTGVHMRYRLYVARTSPEIDQINHSLPVEEQVTPTELMTQAATSRFLETPLGERFKPAFEALNYTPMKFELNLNDGIGAFSPPYLGRPLQQFAPAINSAELDVNPYTPEVDNPSFVLENPNVNLVYNFIDGVEDIAVMLQTSTFNKAGFPTELVLSLDTGVTIISPDGLVYDPTTVGPDILQNVLNGNHTGWVLNVPRDTAFSLTSLAFDARQDEGEEG